MKILYLLISISTSLIIHTSPVRAQYKYIGDYSKEECSRNPSPAIYRGYSCSGDKSCDTNLTCRSQSPYNSLSSIARLLEVDDPAMVDQANPNYDTDVVGWNKLVYVPITCTCPNGWMTYLKRITYTIPTGTLTLYDITNNTFQGLTTCQVIQDANPNVHFSVGSPIYVPLRCACPTIDQKNKGVRSLITYVVGEGENISSISTHLNVSSESIREANGLNEDSSIYPFTTLLIPFMNDDNKPASKSSSPGLSTGAIIGIVAAALSASLLAFAGAAYKFNLCGSIFSWTKVTINNSFKGTKGENQNRPGAATD